MPPTTGRIYDRNRLEGRWATNLVTNREESLYELLGAREGVRQAAVRDRRLPHVEKGFSPADAIRLR